MRCGSQAGEISEGLAFKTSARRRYAGMIQRPLGNGCYSRARLLSFQTHAVIWRAREISSRANDRRTPGPGELQQWAQRRMYSQSRGAGRRSGQDPHRVRCRTDTTRRLAYTCSSIRLGLRAESEESHATRWCMVSKEQTANAAMSICPRTKSRPYFFDRCKTALEGSFGSPGRAHGTQSHARAERCCIASRRSRTATRLAPVSAALDVASRLR